MEKYNAEELDEENVIRDSNPSSELITNIPTWRNENLWKMKVVRI